MPLGTQARLLRVLENGEFIKVGSSKVMKSDVRVVTATNVNLPDAISRNKFREDLYYRLNTVPIYVPPLRERGADADLLFRKFAGDFAERYRVKPVKLSEEARQLLLDFRWPGNIRQLKNIAEQISVLETDRDITGETMRKYLPGTPVNTLPAFIRQDGAGHHDGGTGNLERDLLYQVLFDMKRDMTELKKLVYGMMQGDNRGLEVLKARPELFRDLGEGLSISSPKQETSVAGPVRIDNRNDLRKPESEDFNQVEIITREPASDSLSLQRTEKEMILKALKKNNNKRKYAALDLGISERTLYRKIKEYDIEN